MIDSASILIVDDKPEQLLTLEAVLRDLGQEVVQARSGRDALRCLLQQDFAVILLDINMPGMDGLETASLIRQRHNSRHTPIIFVTAFGDELHVTRGYELGAVDFILTPIVPAVLRTKVSVFIEQYRMAAQVRRQAQALRRRADQLHRLNEAAVAINATLSWDDLLQVITDTARAVVESHQAYTLVNLTQSLAHARCAAALSDKYADWRDAERRFDSGTVAGALCGRDTPLRLSERELDQYPNWREPGAGMPPLRGMLAVPLCGRDGRNVGFVLTSDKQDGEFTQDDEMVLRQLAQIAAIAIENTLYYEAREANRLKDEFLATLSHELRTPLNAILGWAMLLRRQELPASEVAHGLEVIERNVKVQSRLLEDLLEVSRITAGKLRMNLRPLRLAPVVRAALEAVGSEAGSKGLRFNVTLEAEEDEVSGDADRLQQVVWNLVSNAIKFTPAGGEVDVRLVRQGGNVVLSVRDSGVGIRVDFLPHVFDRFRQADTRSKRPHSGLGIGLTIARHLVELHGGTIRAESAGENQGAVFTVELPALAAAQGSGAGPVAAGANAGNGAMPAAPVDLNGLHVLAVDDEQDARELLVRVLGLQKARVTAVGCVAEALSALDGDPVHVLVSDIAMPGADGYDLIRAVRLRGSDRGGRLPALALTAYARDEDRARAMAAGFQMHLPKPVDPQELARAVACLAGRDLKAGAASRDGDRVAVVPPGRGK